MKKLLASVLAVSMAASLAACGAGSGSSAASTAAGEGKSTDTAASAAETTAASEDHSGVKIALVTSKVGTNPFLTQMVKGLEDSAAKYGFEAANVECDDNAQFEENIRAFAQEGYDLVIGGGWEAGDPLNKVSAEFPDSSYAMIDSEIDNASVKCISYNEQEGAYLIGVLAAMTVDGDSHVYGGVHVNEGPGSWKYRYGFMQGVLSQDPEATFVFNYVGSYNDPAKSKTLAQQEASQGAKFINAAAAAGDSGVFEAAKEEGFYTSGQDIDETSADNAYIVSSQIKDTYNTVTLLIDKYFSGWNTDNETWGIKEDAIGAVHVTHESANPRNERLSDDDVAALKQVAEDIRSGKIDLSIVPDEADYKVK